MPGEFHEDRWPRTAEDSERLVDPAHKRSGHPFGQKSFRHLAKISSGVWPMYERSTRPQFLVDTNVACYQNYYLFCNCLASPVWVGWAILHTKTLLDVYLLSSNFANLVLKEDTATGTSISVMTIQSLRFWREVSAYHP